MVLALPEDMNLRKVFFERHVFHERQMNSCPIGCTGCAVSASSSNRGSLSFQDLDDFYQQAADLGVSLAITKVEGYDPVFVKYEDQPKRSFAESIKSAIDKGHRMITPVCTTGAWKSENTQWQLDELGKLANKYRKYSYLSGTEGSAFVLSVPREIKPYANKYDFDEHVQKTFSDIETLTQNGDLEVLIYYNSHVDGDSAFAMKFKSALEDKLGEQSKSRAKLLITNFNDETLPESCYRYENSILLAPEGFIEIDPVVMDWKIPATGQNSFVKA